MNSNNYRNYIWVAGTVALAAVAFAAFANGIGEFKAMKHPGTQVATISVSGEGEVTALPDIATVTMSVRQSAKTVPEAQKMVEEKLSTVLTSLKALEIDEKDTKTTSYMITPQYENNQVYCSGYCITPPTLSNKVIGYEVSQTLEIKVRKIDFAGEVIAALGAASVTDLSGPNFTVEDMEKANSEARARAIADAKEKAKKIASDLGVSLGEVTQFNESTGGYYPMAVRMESYGGVSTAKDSVSLPQGESVINSYVTITYSLK